MPVVPIRNLPPEAEPWGRYVDGTLSDIQQSAAKNAQDINNTLSAQAGTLRRLGEQVADLSGLVATQAAQTATLIAQQAQMNAVLADLAARTAVTVSISDFNTGALPNDSTFHEYGPPLTIGLNVPTGKALISIGCGQTTISPVGGGGGAIAEATFAIVGVTAMGTYYSRFFNSDPLQPSGGPLSVTRAFPLTPGAYTIVGQMRAWTSGTGVSCQFTQPFMTVQVTG